jgi:purine-binding chemotaxis protein CheW
MVPVRQQRFADRTGDAIGRAGLVVSVGSQACFVPLDHVVETTRPLPVETVVGTPPFVRGLSVIRGAPVPVVDLAAVIGAAETGSVSRFIVLRLGDRRVALAVDAVSGVREIDAASMEEMPPLLGGASAEIIAAIGTLDTQFLLVLRATRIVSEDIWQKLETVEAGP